MQALQYLARRAVLIKAKEAFCKERAALIESAAALRVQAEVAAADMQFARATSLGVAESALKAQIATLTEKIDAVQDELDEPEADVLIPFRPRVTLAEQHAAMDDMAEAVLA